MPIYRAVPRETFNPDKIYKRHPGARLPANVPYFVDNLWEFMRPDDKPSRRHAVYASPTVELALNGAAGIGEPTDGLIACQVVFGQQPKMFQLSVRDARYHPDVKHLQKAMDKELTRLAEIGLHAKLALAPLFLPGLTGGELTGLMKDCGSLREFVEKLSSTIAVWSDTPDPAKGEWTFELDEGNTYTLQPV